MEFFTLMIKVNCIIILYYTIEIIDCWLVFTTETESVKADFWAHGINNLDSVLGGLNEVGADFRIGRKFQGLCVSILGT